MGRMYRDLPTFNVFPKLYLFFILFLRLLLPMIIVMIIIVIMTTRITSATMTILATISITMIIYDRTTNEISYTPCKSTQFFNLGYSNDRN